MNPEDIAAGRYKEVRQARERIAKTETAHSKAVERLEELRGRLSQAEARDRTALAAAIVDGKNEPAGEAEGLRAEIGRQELRVEALRLAVGEAHGLTGRIVSDNRQVWRGQTVRELGKAKNRYEKAIAELETARDGIGNEATLLNWLSTGDVSEAATDALGGRAGSDPDGRPVSPSPARSRSCAVIAST